MAEAESLHKAWGERGTRAPGDQKAVAALDAQLLALTGPQFGEAPAGRPPGGLSSLRALGEALACINDAVAGGDAPPTPDAEVGFGTLEPAVEATLSAWNGFKARAAGPVPPAARRSP